MWSKLIQLTHLLENAILSGLLILVIVAANGQIILRNLLELPIVWLDPFLRVTILWLALFGAMVATRQQSHIAIDLLNRYLPLHWCLRAERGVHAFSAVICALFGLVQPAPGVTRIRGWFDRLCPGTGLALRKHHAVCFYRHGTAFPLAVATGQSPVGQQCPP